MLLAYERAGEEEISSQSVNTYKYLILGGSLIWQTNKLEKADFLLFT